MTKHLLVALLTFALCLGATARAQAKPQPELDSPQWVTVMVEVHVRANSESAEALAALNDMRAMMKRQPGYVSETFLKNLNPANPPHYVHVSRWASMNYWAALFRTPEFARLNGHANEHYTIVTAGFVPAESLR
jgi:heme-degrading monooxygenase HmoA